MEVPTSPPGAQLLITLPSATFNLLAGALVDEPPRKAQRIATVIGMPAMIE
jgi:hypothetical protein